MRDMTAASYYIVTKWNDTWPLAKFDTLDEAHAWVMAHGSEWTMFAIEPIWDNR